MNKTTFPTTAAVRYDRALRKSLKMNPPPPHVTVPQFTRHWPEENVALLERYRDWLDAGGASRAVINNHRIPMAGHVLGLNLKPHCQLNLDTDLEKAMAYVQAKQPSPSWQENCRHSLRWFGRFLLQERGLAEPRDKTTYGNAERYQEGLPDWLLAQLETLLVRRQAGWRESRLAVSTYQFWQKYTRVWRWLVENEIVNDEKESLTRIKPDHLYAYMDAMFAQKYAVGSINLDLYNFQGCLRFLQQRGYRIPAALLTLPGLKPPDSLPRFLTDEQVSKLRDDLTERVQTADTPARLRDRRLDLAAFYLLWQGGLRVCELEDLTLADLDLPERRVTLRRSKGLKDRAIYLTDTALAALAAYLELRGRSHSDCVFLYRHKPLSKDIVRCRIKAAGKRTGVKATPHMLRHTFGTQLVNAGCKITTIQALLGHKRITTTMIYTHVYNQTVADDYYAAMTVIEERMQFPHTLLE
ncbi:MAG: tyrosine-type recombinase/integrase [Chloroflexi bacterium]|nr:tyrosine-type recombinase/integrase [Chloroflexota bacterium]